MANQNLVNEIILMIKNGYGTSDILKTLKEEGSSMLEIKEAIEQAQLKIELAKAAGDENLDLLQEELSTPQEIQQNNQEYYPQTQISMQQENFSQNQNNNSDEERMQIPTPQEFQQRYPQRYPDNSEQMMQNIPSPSYNNPQYSSEQNQQYYPQSKQMPIQQETDIEEMVDEIINEKVNEIESKIGNLDLFKQEIKKEVDELKKELKMINDREETKNKEVLSIIQETSVELKMLNGEVIALENAFLKILAPLVSNVKDIKKIIDDANSIQFKKVSEINEITEKIEKNKEQREKKSEKETINSEQKRKKEKETLDKLFTKK